MFVTKTNRNTIVCNYNILKFEKLTISQLTSRATITNNKNHFVKILKKE